MADPSRGTPNGPLTTRATPKPRVGSTQSRQADGIGARNLTIG